MPHTTNGNETDGNEVNRVLLAHAFFMALDSKQADKRRPYPPLGTLYAASGLERAGYQVALFDAMLEPDESRFDQVLDRQRPQVVVLYEDSFNFLSKMCLARMRQAALTMIESAARRGVPVLIAGSDATDEPKPYLEAGATAVMLGEADHTVIEAVAALSRRESLAEVAGLAVGSASGVHRTLPRPPERLPDRFPWPAWHLVDIAAYRDIWMANHGRFSMNMVSTRGCPFHCNWCAKPIWGQRYAMRSPEDVAAEMTHLRAAYAPDQIWFADDIFGLRPEWTVAFGQAVRDLGGGIPFQIQSRVDLMTEPAVEGLAQAGCEEVWLGVESGSQTILDAMEKGIRVEDVGPATARLRSHGIGVGYFLQLGYPGERWSDIEATADLVRAHMPDAIGVSVSYPLPGTRFHDAVHAQLGEKTHWRDTSDLAMMFQGTYSSDLYRAIHDLLHDELDALWAERRDMAGISPADGRGSRARIAGAADVAAGAPAHDIAGDGSAVDAASDGPADHGLERVRRRWEALRLKESRFRRDDPTRIPPPKPRPAPDLVRSAN